jgi:hypothetical protein
MAVLSQISTPRMAALMNNDGIKKRFALFLSSGKNV